MNFRIFPLETMKSYNLNWTNSSFQHQHMYTNIPLFAWGIYFKITEGFLKLRIVRYPRPSVLNQGGISGFKRGGCFNFYFFYLRKLEPIMSSLKINPCKRNRMNIFNHRCILFARHLLIWIVMEREKWHSDI